MIRKAVVPVAGLGTRMLPLTRSVPKEMLPLGRKPAIHHVVDELAAAGIERILFVTSSRKEAIEAYFDSEGHGGQADGLHLSPRDREPAEGPIREQRGPRIEDGSGPRRDRRGQDESDHTGPPSLDYAFVRQEAPAGNGDAVQLGKAFAGSDAFVVAWGDAVIRSTREGSVLRRMMEIHAKEDAACTIAVEYVPEDKVSRYGIVSPVYDSETAFPIDDIVEKPSPENAPSRYAVSARYICGPGIFPALEATPRGRNGELWLADAIRGLLREGGSVWCVPLGSGSRRYDIGTPLTYWEAFADYALEDEAHGTAFRDLLQGRMNDR